MSFFGTIWQFPGLEFDREMQEAGENEKRIREARKKKLIPPGVSKAPFYIGAPRAKRK